MMRTVPGFSVKVRRDGATAIVTPCGELDLATVGTLRAALDDAGRCEVLVLDLREVTFMDSSGIGVLVDERRRAGREGFCLRVVSGPPVVQRLLEVTGLARRLEFTELGGPADEPPSRS